MSDSALQDIHRLQKSDVPAANARLLTFLREELAPPFTVQSVELRPSAVSLNSINGWMQTSAGKKFFKTHIEPASIIGEYYNAGLLEKAGYPVIAPIFASTEYGKQFLIYDYFEASSLFDTIRAIEIGKRNDGDGLRQAQQTSDDLLATLYANSFSAVDSTTHAKQPIHQLFLHRLAGSRFPEFYGGGFVLPQHRLSLHELAQKQWTINGVRYTDNLATLVAKAKTTLSFSGQKQILATTGHGDAHAGNIFYFGAEKPMIYFDPAFAGTHSPLLDIIKPLIHNSLLKWLYFPDEVAAEMKINYRIAGDQINIEHDFRPSALRVALFESKLNRVIAPTLKRMKDQNQLPDNWQDIMQAAAMCCPLLTMNLANRERFKSEIGLLGLSASMEFGGQSNGKGWLEQRLSTIAP